MKIIYKLLSTTILLSLSTISYCSEQQNNIWNNNNNTDNMITVTRQNSGIHHDGTRDGWFGSALDTLKNIREKKSYDGKPYGLGSDGQDRWSKVGENDIKTVADAETFVKEVARNGWTLSDKAMNPSRTLIQNHYGQSKKQAEALITAAIQKLQAHTAYEKTVAQQLRALQQQALADQEKCNGLLPFDGINNNFATTKQLNDTNIRSFISQQLQLQQSKNA